MALPPSTVFRQDMPPPGGYSKPEGFPTTGYRKRSPVRGPPGLVIFGAAIGLTAWGWYRLINHMEEQNYYNLSKFNERFERAYVLQAKEDVAWQRRQKECLDNERKLMAGVEGWVVNKPRFHTAAERKPDMDVLDARKVGPW